MGQVPHKKTYGIVGAGKTAKHIKYYFQCLNILVKTWSRSDSNPVEKNLVDCDVILILITDSEIEPFIKQHSFLKTKLVVHFSGSLSMPGIQSTHPLMTFGEQTYCLDSYKNMSFICEKNKTPFKEIFPELENTHYEIDSETKPFYHSLCVMSGNFTTILWQKFFLELAKLKIPPEAAAVYLDKIVENLKLNPEQALTGPLARKDNKTIIKNLESLEGDSFQKIYKTFVEVYNTKQETIQ